MTKIRFSKNTVVINSMPINLKYKIAVAFEKNGIVIVLFDPDEYIPKFGQFRNLVGLNCQGTKLWEAELPTNETGDCYFKIRSQYPLKAISFKSWICEIDIRTGKIISKCFTK